MTLRTCPALHPTHLEGRGGVIVRTDFLLGWFFQFRKIDFIIIIIINPLTARVVGVSGNYCPHFTANYSVWAQCRLLINYDGFLPLQVARVIVLKSLQLLWIICVVLCHVRVKWGPSHQAKVSVIVHGTLNKLEEGWGRRGGKEARHNQ